MRSCLVFHKPIWHHNLFVLFERPLFCVERVDPLRFGSLHKVFTQKTFLSRIDSKIRSLRKEKIRGIVLFQRRRFELINTRSVCEKLLNLIGKTLKGRAFEVREKLSLVKEVTGER